MGKPAPGRRVFRALLAVPIALAWGACSSDRAPFLPSGDGTPVKDAGNDVFLDIPPPKPPGPDASGFCGNLVVPVVLERPNLYFILDASGSMTQSIPGVSPSRYDAALRAIAKVLGAVGHRVSYGASVFPADVDPNVDSCPAGGEVFATRPGDPTAYAISHETGPTLRSLLRTLGGRKPSGLTPTAASVEAVRGTLQQLEGKTYAFLLTDGAPNCGTTPCRASGCTVNIEGGCGAPAGVNCCDPALGIYDYRWCLDADPTVQAVRDLAASGVKTFVIGLPGTDAYASLLDRLAVAGGTARDEEPLYYPAGSDDELSATLQQIGLSVAISCDVVLKTAPPDPHLVNVYFDQTIVPFDPVDGWTWGDGDGGVATASDAAATEPGANADAGTSGQALTTADASSADAGAGATVHLVGHSCDLLKGGSVIQVQVVSGCPSITR